ncbi:hypothetical protein [Actinomadura sp. J1-007]|uniref:hypothetical protein n=1 Tax=Actinomadura sp. J1-007 TaxID=2661913 RepID=UPI0015816B0E|nr:hypothetical protein [Actinomadura sp. J1-007]
MSRTWTGTPTSRPATGAASTRRRATEAPAAAATSRVARVPWRSRTANSFCCSTALRAAAYEEYGWTEREASRRLSMDLVKWFDCPWPVTATGTWCGTGLASA